MLFVIALILAVLFVYFCRDLLKKYPYPFYIGAAVITVAVSLGNYTALPLWVNRYVVGLFSKGAFGTALFVIVMYTGALKNGTKRIAELMKIRGELSIFAAILVLAHNCIYGRNYFKLLFTRPAALPVNQLAAAVVSLFLITDMVVLTITSFPQIRKKMKAKNWKKLQRTAYMFYGFIYIHILLIHIPLARRGIQASLWNVFVYSIVFISYAVLRIRKYILMKNKAKISENPQFARHTNFLSGVAGVVLFLAVFLPTAIGNATQTKAAAKKNTVAVQKTTNETITETTKETAGTQQMTETVTDSQENNEDTAQEEDTVQSDEPETEQNTEPEGSSTPKNLETEKETINEAKEEESAAVQPVPTEAARTYKADGEYTGTAVCDIYGYQVTVKITIAGDTISKADISTDASALDADYADMAINGLKRKLVSNQGSAGLDAVSGATYSSNAIFQAFDSAVNAAK